MSLQYYKLSSLVEHLAPTLKLSRVFGLISGFWLLFYPASGHASPN